MHFPVIYSPEFFFFFLRGLPWVHHQADSKETESLEKKGCRQKCLIKAWEVISDPKARSIMSGPESPTEPLSRLVENLLKPIVPCLTTYVKDDWDFYDFCLVSQVLTVYFIHVIVRVFIFLFQLTQVQKQMVTGLAESMT